MQGKLVPSLVRELRSYTPLQLESLCTATKCPDRKYRGDAARRNTSEGSGLGLFIAKQILTLNNIDVWAENNGNGLTVFALLERSDKKPVNWFKLEK